MAGRLGALARNMCQSRTLLPVRGGGGGPVALGRPPKQPLPEEDELVWDDGTAQPEWCLDQFPLVTKYEALGYLLAGFGVFAAIGVAAKINNKQASVPYAPREYPFDNFKVELGGETE